MTVKPFLTMLIVMFSLAAHAGGTYMNVSTDRKYVVGRTRGKYVVINGKTVYIPGAPIFETRTTGFSVKIGKITVKDHGIGFKINVKKVDAKDMVADVNGNAILLAKYTFHKINGQRSKLLGKHEGRAYFRELKSRKVVSAALADVKEPKSESREK